jgi:hypothetical protein
LIDVFQLLVVSSVQGANGHLKQQEKDNVSVGSRNSIWKNKEGLLLPDIGINANTVYRVIDYFFAPTNRATS